MAEQTTRPNGDTVSSTPDGGLIRFAPGTVRLDVESGRLYRVAPDGTETPTAEEYAAWQVTP